MTSSKASTGNLTYMGEDYVTRPVFNTLADPNTCPDKANTRSLVRSQNTGGWPHPNYTTSPPLKLPITAHAPSTIMLGNIQQVSFGSGSIQTWSRPASGKCLNSIMDMPCGALLGFPLCTLPESTRSLGNLPHSLTSRAFNQETWDMFVGAVSICCFLPVARWRGGS